MTELVATIVESIQSFLTGLGSSIVSLAESLFFTGTGETKTLTTFALVVFTLTGVSIAFAIAKWVLGLVKLN